VVFAHLITASTAAVPLLAPAYYSVILLLIYTSQAAYFDSYFILSDLQVGNMSRYLTATLSPVVLMGCRRSLLTYRRLGAVQLLYAPMVVTRGAPSLRSADMGARGFSVSAKAASDAGSSWPAAPKGAQDVHQFWFNGKPDENNPSLWWGGSKEVDAEVQSRFRRLVDQALAGTLGDAWEASPTAACAKVILCDQFTRQTARGTPGAFAGDVEAQRLAVKISKDPALLDALSCYERIFSIVLPCMHSEHMEHHELAQGLLKRWAAETTNESHAEAYRGTVDFLTEHTEVVARFGRYPSRNAALGRETTAEEDHHLSTNAKAWEVSQSKS
jgi:uncharacterized protein (DUF924 family)